MSAPGEPVDDFITEVLPAFISEAGEQVDSIESLLLQIEAAPGDRGLLDALFRCAHTVKGSAGIFGLDAVVAFTHHVETLLDRLREGQVAFTPGLGTLLLQCNDQIRLLISHCSSGAPAPGDDQRAALVLRLQQAAGVAVAAMAAPAGPAAAADAAPAAASAQPAWQVSIVFGPDSLRDGMDPLAMVNHLARQGPLLDLSLDTERVPPLDQLAPEDSHIALRFGTDGQLSRAAIESAFSFVLADSQLTVEPAPTLPPAAAVAAADGAASSAPGKAAAATAPAEEPRYIRVQADRLDAVINLLGELVIAGASASLLARQARQRQLLEANAQVSQLIEEIRNSTLKMRMVPIGETFARFRRVVRDTAAELGKDVQLELVGSETELDKSVVERIADPLMHLVRNALDHGLEPPDQRQQAGKPASGRLCLSARHESGSVLIRIEDDGRGIQRRKVLERAWQRGLLEPGTVPPDAEIDQLIFEPGFSTAETVTNLSGRGVGMDVVRRNIEALRGSVQLSSTPGEGSRIDIRLPLTLAIIDGFLVGVGRSRFIFPLEAVLEVVEPAHGAQRFDTRGRGLLELRGGSLPVVNLRALYGLDGEPAGRSSVVVLRAGDRRYGVLVDTLLGQHQTVIKPLSRLFSSLRGVSGSSVLATGEVALIVDVHALCTLAARAPAHAPSFKPPPAPGAHLSLAPAQGTLS